jgi:hypothetical protein
MRPSPESNLPIAPGVAPRHFGQTNVRAIGQFVRGENMRAIAKFAAALPIAAYPVSV